MIPNRYDDALWKAFGVKLEDALCYELDWSRPGGPKSSLGSVDLCSAGALNILSESINHAASKGKSHNLFRQVVSYFLYRCYKFPMHIYALICQTNFLNAEITCHSFTFP